MIYPERFPFDVLDPAPAVCLTCGCHTEAAAPESVCQWPAECHCHEVWREDTDELLKREMWGDK